MGGRVLSWVFAVRGRSGRRGKPQEVFALAWGIYRVFAVRIWHDGVFRKLTLFGKTVAWSLRNERKK
jgi:hypothetical protein